MRIHTFLAAGAALAMIFGSNALADEAQTIRSSISATELEALLTGAGLSPTMLTDKATGNPVATGQTAGMVFVVRAMDCDGRPARCEKLVLFANFDLGREIGDRDYRIVNGFNEKNLYGRAYVLEDKSQIGVDYIIDMTGGVTGAHIGSRLGKWPEVIEGFAQQMRSAQTGS